MAKKEFIITKETLKDYSDKIYQTFRNRGIDVSRFTTYRDFLDIAKEEDNVLPHCHYVKPFQEDNPSWYKQHEMTLEQAKLTPFMTQRFYVEEMYYFYLDWFDVEFDKDDDIRSFSEFLYFQQRMSRICHTNYRFYDIDFVFVAEDDFEFFGYDYYWVVTDELIANGNIQKSDIEDIE